MLRFVADRRDGPCIPLMPDFYDRTVNAMTDSDDTDVCPVCMERSRATDTRGRQRATCSSRSCVLSATGAKAGRYRLSTEDKRLAANYRPGRGLHECDPAADSHVPCGDDFTFAGGHACTSHDVFTDDCYRAYRNLEAFRKAEAAGTSTEDFVAGRWPVVLV